jgi:hypothetical protein
LEPTRRELLGQAMDLNSLRWLLAACQAGGQHRVSQSVGRSAGGTSFCAGGQRAGGACGGGRVSLLPQHVGSTEAAGAGLGATGQRAGGARGGGRVSLPPQPVGIQAKT